MIYFAQMQTMPYLIKIGFTQEDNLDLRVKSLQSETKNEVLLLLTLKGDRSKEMKLHSKFQDACVMGEWFFPSVPLLKFLSKNSGSDKGRLVKRNELYSLINFKNAIANDYLSSLEELKGENRNLKKESNDLYEESKRLLSENIKLLSELRKLKQDFFGSETKERH